MAKTELAYDFEPEDDIGDYFDEVEFRYRYRAEPEHYWYRARRRILLSVVERHLRPGAKVLEVGCGCGHFSSGLEAAGYEVWPADLSTLALEYCAERGLGPLTRTSLLTLPFVDEFDAACAFDVIEHIEDDEACVRRLARAVHPGGTLFVTVPAHPHLWGTWDRLQRHERRYAPSELEDLLGRSGLEVVAVRQFFGLLYLPALVAATVDRALGAERRTVEPQTVDQHHNMWSPPGVSRILTRLLGAEARTINSRLPSLGTSLVGVARRPRS